MSNDELLAQFRSGSKEAFDALVARNIDWVYSAALRQVRDPHLADDVTQSAFILLAKKGPSLKPTTPLEPWLFKVTRFASLEALRRERRRKKYEQKAAAMIQEATPHPTEQEWEHIAPLLDELVARLAGDDRRCILLRYYQRRTYPQIGHELGISEEAARKRVDRAVQKLRGYFARAGVTTTAAVLGVTLGAHTTHAAAPTAMALCAAPATPGAAALANSTITAMSIAQLKPAAGLIAGILLFGIASVGVVATFHASHHSREVASTANSPLATAAVRADPLGQFPYPTGWPLALPGVVTGAPAIADLEGNGKLAIIVPCEAQQGTALAHPAAGRAVLLMAIHADGSPVPGWPVELLSADDRVARRSISLTAESWYSSPSIATDASGHTFVVTTIPYVSGTCVIDAGGKIVHRFPGGRQWTNIAIADLTGDHTPDLIAGGVMCRPDGTEIPGFQANHASFQNGDFASCVGDADNDGSLDIFRFELGLRLDRYSRSGDEMPGWPRNASCVSRVVDPHQHAPVMGDITGDSKKEVVVCTEAIWAWTCDGHPITNPTGILVPNIDAPYTGATLADLDGDGKAEIIVFDNATRSIRAFHGDGRGVGNPRGIIAQLPTDCRGVSVADLGADGIIDLFAGVYWIQYDPKTAQSAVIPMTAGDPISLSQPTITDIDHDGQADIVFGTRDGRIFIYNTHLAYRPELVQWGTAAGNFQRTGVWEKPHTNVAQATARR